MTTAPTITFFHPSFLVPGGAELLCANQARHLVARGCNVRLVTFAFDQNTWAGRFHGIEVITVPKRAWTDLFAWDRYPKIKTRARRAHPALKGADLIIAHNAPCNFMLGLRSLPGRRIWQCNEPPRKLHRRLANPYLTASVDSAAAGTVGFATDYWRKALQEDSSILREARKRKRLARLEIEATQRLDQIYAISEFARNNARQIYGKCQEEVVYPFVRFPKGGLRSGPIARSGLEVLVQSRLEILKNVDSIIRGFAAYLPNDPDAVLHVVGDGPLRQELESLARELMPAHSCRVHGYLSTEDLQVVYERCDVFALLALDEPFGMVYPEAVARGLLVIGPNHGGPFEILEGGRIGHCIDPFDPEALVEALQDIRSLSTSEADRRRIAADRSCKARFGDAAIEASLLRTLGLS